jgi:hypothetical protein
MTISPEMFETILKDIEDGLSLRKTSDKHSISTRTIWEFIQANQKNENRYAQAKEKQIENLLEEIHTLEDEMQAEIRICEPKIANAVATGYRTRIDNLKWIASKLKPKKYGERLNLDADTTLHITMQDDSGKALRV